MGTTRRVMNPPNPYESQHLADLAAPPPHARLEVYEENARSILSENQSGDLGFRFSLNPYRGCFHGCVYCYARPTHQYLGMGAGTDFDRKLVVKVNAPELLSQRLGRRGWGGDAIAFSGNTDCYQPLEASYALTRRCLEICARHANPVGIITKGHVIRRDIDLLLELDRRARCRITISLAFADDEMRRRFDPWAPPVEARVETLRRLAEAGLDVGVAVAPIIPGVNDMEVPALLERAREAGARRASSTLLRLPREVKPYFEARLEESLPLRASKVRNALREMRGGRMNDPRFGHRLRGTGTRWQVIEQMFRNHASRLGLDIEESGQNLGPPIPPARRPKRQLELFDHRDT